MSPNIDELRELVHKLKDGRVLVVGDVMLDRYVTGNATRLSPEAPIPVLSNTQSRSVLGGAANVASNIASLGASASLVGAIGEDWAGNEVVRLLSMAPQISPRLLRVENRPTTTKTRYIAGTQQLLRLDKETTEPLGAPGTDALLQQVREELGDADIVIISDYAKGVLSNTLLDSVIAESRAAGLVIIVDPKRSDFIAYQGATIITPNLREIRIATRCEAVTDDEIEVAGRQALELTKSEAIIVTRGESGLTIIPQNAKAVHLPTNAVEVADISGAGDTFVATLAAALSIGASNIAAASLANFAAGVSVGKHGTAAVNDQELTNVLRFRAELTEDKILSIDDAAARIEGWHRRGLRVGLANGCFDLIHPGHVRLLAEARSNCDRLVVALNSDASTKRLKGPTRPVQNEIARAAVIASFSTVDLVVVFGEDTPLKLIGNLRPDVLIKGSDYAIDQIVGADLVRGWGGDVIIVPLNENYSTTNTIKRISMLPSSH